MKYMSLGQGRSHAPYSCDPPNRWESSPPPTPPAFLAHFPIYFFKGGAFTEGYIQKKVTSLEGARK